jgi:hypothetical protein
MVKTVSFAALHPGYLHSITEDIMFGWLIGWLKSDHRQSTCKTMKALDEFIQHRITRYRIDSQSLLKRISV